MPIQHAYTALVPSPGPATTVVGPANWNDNHSLAYILSGNILGSTVVSGTDIIMKGDAGMTLSGTSNSIVFYQDPSAGNVFGVSNIGNTGGTSGVVSNNGIQAVMVGGNNVTLSQATLNNKASLSVLMESGPGKLMSFFEPIPFLAFQSHTVLASTLGTSNPAIQFFQLENPLTISYLQYIISLSLTCTSSKDLAYYYHTFWLLSRNSTNLQVLNSFTSCTLGALLQPNTGTGFLWNWNLRAGFSITGSSLFTGLQLVAIPFSTSLSMGEYWIAEQHMITGLSGSTNPCLSISFLYNTNLNLAANFPGEGSAINRIINLNGRFMNSTSAPDNITMATSNTTQFYPGEAEKLYIGFRGYDTFQN